MKQIYKRQPIQRELPSNYNDLDAVNYLNINGFKGLQVYDNPLIAEQNSTYSCKNVYTDEHGNLTVRPALTPLPEQPGCYWEYRANNGIVLQLKSRINPFPIVEVWELHINNNAGVTQIQLGYFQNLYPIETDDAVYVFMVYSGSNNLVRIPLDSFDIEVVTGPVLFDDPAKTDISHYNILNDKILYEYTADLQAMRSESDYTPLANAVIVPENFGAPYEKLSYIYPIDTSNVLCIGTTKVLWYERIYSVWRCTELALPFDESTLPQWWFPLDEYQQNNASEFYEDECMRGIPLRYILPQSDGSVQITECSIVTENREIFGDTTIYLRQYTVSLTSAVQSAYTRTFVQRGLSTIIPTATGFAALVWTGDISSPALKLITYTIGDIEPKPQYTFADTPSIPNSSNYSMFWHLACDKHNLYWACMVRGQGREFVHAGTWDAAYLHTPITFDSSIYLDFTTDEAIGIRAFSGSTAGFLVLAQSAESETFLLYELLSRTMWNFDTQIPYQNEFLLDTYSMASSVSIFIDLENDTATPVYELFGTKLLTYSADETLYVPQNRRVLFDGELLLQTADKIDASSYDGDIYLEYRTKNIVKQELTRPTDVIPVISEIRERVITSFFLDNCWWFITAHSIFGTGVDGNGLATLERFDPLKYFKISETIIGAMRVSDTSFWVFHNNGAYLIYKTALALTDGTEYRWLYTATAKSKGCDFENALHTLPVTSYGVTVTASDICNIVMRENVQSDERVLVPLTTQFSAFMRELLQKTASVKIFDYKYLTIFMLNPAVATDTVIAVVYDNVTTSWWYWDFPINEVYSIRELEDYTALYCNVGGVKTVLRLTDDEYYYDVGSLRYEIYADRLNAQTLEPTPIDWHWQSAVQIFDTVERRKQLLFTTFVFDDYAPDNSAEQLIELGYYFDIYSYEYLTSQPDTTTVPVYRVSNRACRTTIGSFNYLQLNLQNREFDTWNFEVLTKPKICCISMKYRILRGEV